MTRPIPARRWFRFRLRTLLIVVAVLAVPLAWIAKERRQSEYERRVAKQLREQGFQDVVLYGRFVSTELILQDKPQGWWRDLARQVLGERIFAIWGPPANFHDLESLTGLTSIEALDLNGVQVGDLSPLARLPTLKHLLLMSVPIHDVKPLAALTNLEWISLRSTPITDLSPLRGLTKLRALVVQDTPAGAEQIESLQTALPNCKILHDPFF